MDAEGKDSTSKKIALDNLSKEELLIKCKGLLGIAQKAKQARSEIQNEVLKYKDQLEICESQKKAKEENVLTLQELVDSLTEQKLTFITEIDATQSKLRALTNKCSEYEEEINEQKAEMMLKDQKFSKLSQELSNIDSEVISLKRQNNRLLEENEQLITQLTELESKTVEFNHIGLQQREQLKILEEKVQQDGVYQAKIEELNNNIIELEEKLKSSAITVESKTQVENYERKIEELSKLYESEKSKKERTDIKLRSYKDKILKCANCINQLKNSRFILTKTVTEYSENIPKWQNEIIKASKVLDDQMKELNNENVMLKEKLQQKEKEFLKISTEAKEQMCEVNDLKQDAEVLNSQLMHVNRELTNSEKNNFELTEEIALLKSKEINSQLLHQNIEENTNLKENITKLQKQLDIVSETCQRYKETVKKLKDEKVKLNQMLNSKNESDDEQQKLNLLIKSLESEKATLVKEKQNAKDIVIELENKNKVLQDQLNKMKEDEKEMKIHINAIKKENKKIQKNYQYEKDHLIKELNAQVTTSKEQYDKIKLEYDNLQDLNTLLQEEVETLRISLEQPKDDSDNVSGLNVSLQADIVKLETKLAAYKQENGSLLMEVKESRSKMKEFDAMAAEYEEMKTKLISYKTENAELLNEMKEINQVLKERGEAISKYQKAVSEMEKLIETLEKDRDSVKEERDNFMKQIDNLQGLLKNATQNNTAIEVAISEKDAAVKQLEEKDALIASLKEEIDKLKQGSSAIELPNEDMSTSTISRAEDHSRMKDLDETFEDKYTKLRMFALKLKKKLNETTAQLQSSEQEQTKLKKLLAEKNLDAKQKVTNPEGLNENLAHKSNISDLESKVKSLTETLESAEKATMKIAEIEASIQEKHQELHAEIEAHTMTKELLEKALKHVKKKNVLSLEMEDYERSMKELTTKMEENKKRIIQMESTIDSQEGTITAMKTQIKLLEEQIKTEETQNRFLKEELQQAIQDGKTKDHVVNSKKDIISKLMHDLEDIKRKNEETEIEMTSALTEKEKIITSFGEEKLELNSKLKKMEFKCAELNEKLRISNIELEDLKTEYTRYKVRAQAVLRQNQTVDHSQEEQLKEEVAALKAQVETLNQKHANVQAQCLDLNTVVESGKKRSAEATAETARAHQRTARLQADLTRLSQQLDVERSQQKIQISTLTQCYKTQITELETKLQKETESLYKQIELLKENSKPRKSNEDTNRDKYTMPVIPREEGSDNEMDINVSLIPREEGEGSEAAPSPPLSKSFLSGGGRRSPVPLERLLEEGVPDNDLLDTPSLSLTSEQEIADLRRKVQAQQQRVKHVTVLLAESERECARLGQLSELLKGELRRVRASAANAHNTEYMKNVTLKFLTLPPGDERSRLVPVLEKILTLSSDETHKIQAIAKGQDPNPSKGWGSYLPWPGTK